MLHERATLLPGVLALFGIQLLAVFSSVFQDGLDRTEQRVHLVSIVLVAVTIAALVMPGAYLREERSGVPPAVIRGTRRALQAAMLLLAIAIPLEVFLAACVILRGQLAIALGIVALALFLILWVVVPFARRGAN
jgi:hypothetical protein